MAKYVLVFHGGGVPETEEEGAELMAAWGAWMAELDGSLVDQGNAFGAAATIHADGTITKGGGQNPATGYTVVDADSLDAAVELAGTCPILDSGGSVEVAETIDM